MLPGSGSGTSLGIVVVRHHGMLLPANTRDDTQQATTTARRRKRCVSKTVRLSKTDTDRQIDRERQRET